MERAPIFAAPRHVERLEDCYFYHTMELPGLGVQNGHWDLRGRFDEYVGNVGVRGKSVLDVGTATGFLSFEAERRGAARVVSFDMSDVRQQNFVIFPNKRPRRDKDEWLVPYAAWMDRWKNAYWLCHRLLESRAEVVYGNIYELPSGLGTFDVTIVGSILEHLRDPVKALESLTSVIGETLVIVTPVIEREEPIAWFEPRQSKPEQDYTWWFYSIGLYRELLGILGFDIERVTPNPYWHQFEQRYQVLTTIVARRLAG